MTASRPLNGITVLDFTRVYSGPYATRLLADLGATVIKVEHPRFGDDSRAFGPFVDGYSGYFETLNRGKRSIAIDHRVETGQSLLRRLATRVDVLIENFRPGQMQRYRLDYDALSALNPCLVYVSLSGFGQVGSDARLGCYDIVAQAMSGLMSLTGLPDQPLKTGPAIADAISGLTAATGLLAALVGRERTGRGAHVDVAMIDAVFACLENALVDYTVTEQVPARHGNIDTVIAPFDSFHTLDGWIVIGAGNDRLWQALARLIDPALAVDARFATNLDRVSHYAELRPVLENWCAARSTQALLIDLHAAGIPAGPVRAMDELAHDPCLEARGMLARLTLASGASITVPGSPIQLAGVEPPPIVRGPLLGEHTRAVLRDELKLEQAEVAQLSNDGVIACADSQTHLS
ncbi:MAG: CoA transferase [Chloroflexi bacterium]|nr:CoA transferase [Chloroflexota bacterium]